MNDVSSSERHSAIKYIKDFFTKKKAYIHNLCQNVFLVLESKVNLEDYIKLIEHVYRSFYAKIRISIVCEKSPLKVLDKSYYSLRSIEMEGIIYDAKGCKVEEIASIYIPNLMRLKIGLARYLKLVSIIHRELIGSEGVFLHENQGFFVGFVKPCFLRKINYFRNYLGLGKHMDPLLAFQRAIRDFEGEY